MVAISYFAVVSYTRSINTLTDDYLSQLVERIAEQTDSLGEIYFKHLGMLSKYPFVQLSFQQYPDGGQLSTTRDKLELFRTNTGSFDSITLFANDGRIVAATPYEPPENSGSQVFMGRLVHEGRDQGHYFSPDSSDPKVFLFARVYDFQNTGRTVGFATAEVDLDAFLGFIRQLDIGGGVFKSITVDDGTEIYNHPAPPRGNEDPAKKFTASSSSLGWEISVLVPDRLLFRDVNRLAGRLLTFTALVAVLAMIALLAASRMAIRPLVHIIDGIKEFAAGNMNYRIRGIRGVETRRVAAAFNTMAKELQKRQKELIQADKMASLGLLSAGFAHEVRNPLAGIKTSAQVLAKHSPSRDARSLARGISKEVDRLNKLVGDLLHFSRPQASVKKTCDLVAIIDQALKILRSEIHKKNIQIINRVDSHPILVAPEQMLQILINLILNALAAVEPDKGIVRISSRVSSENEFVVKLRDNGHGISQDKINRVFDPFFSLSREGTGLGLSVVKMLLKENNIRIDVESIEKRGTTFTLRFHNHTPITEETCHG